MSNVLQTATNGKSPMANSSAFSLSVPTELLTQVPEFIRADRMRCEEYLLNATKLGLNALSQASLSLDTTQYVEAVRAETQAIRRISVATRNHKRMGLESSVFWDQIK
jgi:hypothetical protein